MEVLAIMKAIAKACELVRGAQGQLKAVAIYTDSVGAIGTAHNPKHALGQHIIRKARTLTKSGATLSLHWCPGHGGVSNVLRCLTLHSANRDRFLAMN